MTPHSPTVHCFSGMVMVWLVSLTVEIIARQSVRVSCDFMRGWEAESSPGTTSTIFCLAEYLCRLKRLAALSDLRLWGEQTLSEMIIFSENHYHFLLIRASSLPIVLYDDGFLQTPKTFLKISQKKSCYQIFLVKWISNILVVGCYTDSC